MKNTVLTIAILYIVALCGGSALAQAAPERSSETHFGGGFISRFLFGEEQKAPGPLPVALHAPFGLSARGVSESRNDILWQEAPGATAYRVYRDGALWKTVIAPVLSDTGLQPDTRYCYSVASMDKEGKESERSDLVCATTSAPAKPLPAVPSGIRSTAVSKSQIDVAWEEASGSAIYNIYRDGIFLAASRTTSLSDTGLRTDNLYCYAVSAVNASGKESEKGEEACTRIPGPLYAARKMPSSPTAARQEEIREKGRAVIDIEFDTDKATIKRRYHQELKEFADVVQANPDLHVVLEGHTDNVGSRDYNLRLSLKRAESVREYLVKQFGVKASRLTSMGYGMSKPITGNSTAEGRMKNRRVEAAVNGMPPQTKAK